DPPRHAHVATRGLRAAPATGPASAIGFVHQSRVMPYLGWKADIQAEFIRVLSYGFRDGHDGGS
ncbi:MAG: hypothetical protein ACJ8BC_14510, partial [Gemmatimonadales bacterium]